MSEQSPEVKSAIEIADKHLNGFTVERRMALATDIMHAIIDHSNRIATEAIRHAFAGAKTVSDLKRKQEEEEARRVDNAQ